MNRVASEATHQRVCSLVGATARSWHGLGLAAGFIAAYLLLAWVSYVGALYGLHITAWNPHRGLAFALLIVLGLRYMPAVALAVLASTLTVSDVSVPLPVAIAIALIIAIGYGAAATVLSHVFGFDARLHRARDVILLIGIATIAAGLVALGVVASFAAAGLVPWSAFFEASSQLWIGNAIGAIVVTTLVLVAIEHPPRRWKIRRGQVGLLALESIVQWGSIVGAFALFFTFNRHRAELLYLLFLPLVWIAARRGLVGAAWAVLTIQIGLIAVLQFEGGSAETIRTFQLLMFAIAATGLILGAFVNERLRVGRALAESQEHLATILSAARDGVLTVDAKGRIESVNPSVERLFGRPAHLLIGHDVRDIIESPQLFRSSMSTMQSAPDSAARWELNARRSDGASFPIELTVGPFGAPGQEHYTLVIRDITSRREAEIRTRIHQSELTQMSRLSLAGEMASALAHELNQPLTAIAAYARGCLRLIRPDRQDTLKEGIEGVVQQSERAANIITRLRDFVRTGSPQRTAVNVQELVAGALALARPEAGENGVDVQSQVATDLPSVLADRIQIEQVILNLVRNAVDAMLASEAKTKAVTLDARRTARHTVEISVADTGPGVPPEVLERLFDPFVTTKPTGMGLGLSICRSIMDAHGGQLRLMRQSESGAVFAFDLPIATGNEIEHDR